MRQPRTGLPMFAHFTKIILEARVVEASHDGFVQKYGVRTGESCREGVLIRSDSSAWKYSVDTKVYFDAPDWILDNFKMLGIHVTKGVVCSLKKVCSGEQHKNIDQCRYTISSNEFFWWLVDYGYRLGENAPIPFPAQEKSVAV